MEEYRPVRKFEVQSEKKFFCGLGIAWRPWRLDSPGVFEGFQISIEVPLAYTRREQLLDFIQSKFPGAEISAVHSEVADPTVAEVLVRHDGVTDSDSAKSDSTISGLDSEAVLLRVTEALAEFTKSAK